MDEDTPDSGCPPRAIHLHPAKLEATCPSHGDGSTRAPRAQRWKDPAGKDAPVAPLIMEATPRDQLCLGGFPVEFAPSVNSGAEFGSANYW